MTKATVTQGIVPRDWGFTVNLADALRTAGERLCKTYLLCITILKPFKTTTTLLYWVCQKAHSDFPIRCCRKPEWTFWPTHLLMILWVSNLGWTQLDGSSVGFTWGQSYGWGMWLAYLRLDHPKWFHLLVWKLAFDTYRESLLPLHGTSHPLLGYPALLYLVISGKQERVDPSVPLSIAHLLLTYWSKWIT